MDALAAISRMETPTLVINHCSDVGCSHPSCWASRKLYRRNAYLLMLKGIPPSDIHQKQQQSVREAAPRRAAEIPTQKVHNLVDELFNSVGHSLDAEDWQFATGGGRGISAGQLSIKHMPTPMSSLSRQQREPKSKQGAVTRQRVARSSEEGNDAGFDPELDDEEENDFDGEEEEDEDDDQKDQYGRRRQQGGRRRPAAKQRVLRVQDMSQQQQQQQGEAARKFFGLHNHSREYVWVPNPNRKPREGPLRRSDPDPSLGRVNINDELSQYLQEDNYNQRQAALQERAVERSHLSTARVQRFFKTQATTAAARQNVDLFKLPSDLLSEVLRSVDQGEPMTNESLARMVEQATESPTAQAGQTQVQAEAQQQQAASSSEFERHVLRQRRAQLHNSESGRNLREPQKHTAKAPVFLMDCSGVEVHEKRRLPPIEAATGEKRDKQNKKSNAKTGGGTSRLVTGHFKRSLGRDCQLMLGPVSADATPSNSTPLSARSQSSSVGDGSGSMAVECRSNRSTLLDEVLPSRIPGGKDSALATLLAMNRPSYDLDDPWGDAYHAEAPHPTTRDGTRLTIATSSMNDDEVINAEGSNQELDEVSSAAGGACLSLTTPVPDADLDNEKSKDEADVRTDEFLEADQDSARLLNPAATKSAQGHGPGPPPPSPDVPFDDYSVTINSSIRAASPPPPMSPQTAANKRQANPRAGPAEGAHLSKAKSAASSGQLMPTLKEDEEVNE